MFQATLSFSTQHGFCGLQVDAINSGTASTPAVEMTFRVKDYGSASFREVRVGRLVGYTAWSEAPLALLFRCLHWLRVEGFSSIPPSLISHAIRDMSLTIQHRTRESLSEVELGSLSLSKTGYEEGYQLTLSSPNRARFSMEIDSWSAVPLGAALKAVAQVQLEAIDLHRFPKAPIFKTLTDGNGVGQILREEIPYYADSSFKTFRARFPSISRSDGALVPANHWRDFLTA
jgi:hypothetical protein